MRKIYEKTHTNTNLQYDQFNSTKEVIKNIRAGKEQRIGNELTTQALVVNSIWKHSNKSSSVLWSKVITQLPININNFCIRYLNNTLANNTNLHKWLKAPSPLCSACNKPETLGHAVAGCSVHLNEKRYNYRHDSVLPNIVKSIKSSEVRRIYAYLEGYISPSIISGEDKRPDIIIVERDNVYILELTIDFETNISTNFERKMNNYSQLLEDLRSRYKKVKFINLSMGSIGIYGDTCFNLKPVLKQLGLNENEVNYLLRKLSNICIQATYFIFCKRNKAWDHPACPVSMVISTPIACTSLVGYLLANPFSPTAHLLTIFLPLGSPHATVQGAMPVSSVSGSD